MQAIFSKIKPHILAFIGFVVVALMYFYPVLQGKQIFQSDIVQYIGMSKELKDFRAEKGEETYWTNSAFGGMPTYQLGAQYPHNYIKKLDQTLRFLPRPADYLFLYFLGFYVLMMVLKIDPLTGFVSALAFGFSTYLIIILGVGHNAKAHAIAYMPMVLAGILLVFQHRYIWGGVLTTIAAALEIQANHFQMTYYLLFLLALVAICYYVLLIKKKDWQSIGWISGTLILAAILSVALNASNILATSEYTSFSTRGANELTIQPNGRPVSHKTGMSYEYITEYSYGKLESLNLIAPRLFGGSNNEKLDQKSEVYAFLLDVGASPEDALDFASSMPTYWGDQPIVAAPAYIGVVVFFLALLGFFVVRNRIKWVFLAAILLSLLLSWGKNFPALTNFFIDYVPLYNKFRAVSSIQVILELCMPIMAALGIYHYLQSDKEIRWKAFKLTSYIAFGLLLGLFVFKSSFDFTGSVDAILRDNFERPYGVEFADSLLEALRNDRKAMFVNDLLRSGLFILLASLLLVGYHWEKITKQIVVLAVGLLMTTDLVWIAKNYVNEDSFVAAREMEEPFPMRPVDEQILKDTDLHYRVFEPQVGMNGASTSYYHKHLGGYSAVKPQRMQQLYDFHIAKSNLQVMNMLNMKYYITQTPQGQIMYNENPDANGNAWFVNEVQKVKKTNDEILALNDINTYKQAVIGKDFSEKITQQSFVVDSTAQITLTSYEPNKLVYTTVNSKAGLAVFSEIYYPNGWKATIDGKEASILRANYVLRALEVPAGKHQIVFSFEPEVVAKGSTISLFSSITLLLLMFGLLYWKRNHFKP